MRFAPRALLTALALLPLLGCASAVQSVYVKAGYDAKTAGAVKRIAVTAWAPAEHPKLADLLASVAEDRIKLKMSYLVYRAGPMARGWSDACSVRLGSEPEPGKPATEGPKAEEPMGEEPAPEGPSAEEPTPEEQIAGQPAPDLEGVLSVRAYDVTLGTEIKLHLVAELHSCQTGALLWRTDGSEGNPTADEDLVELTKSYVANLGEEVNSYAAPAFLVLRDMLDALPDVVLTDDEVMEKIELE